MHILFVCTGNTCRSPMAEGILKTEIEKEDMLKGKISVSSAGLSAYDGDSASKYAVATMEEWGIDIRQHRAKNLKDEDVRQADLILAMTRSHKNALISCFPEAMSKIFTLKEFISRKKPESTVLYSQSSGEISDPYGMPLAEYNKVASEMQDAMGKLVADLKDRLDRQRLGEGF